MTAEVGGCGGIAKEEEEEGRIRGLACSAPAALSSPHRWLSRYVGGRLNQGGAGEGSSLYRRLRRRLRREGRAGCSECRTSLRSAAPYSPFEPAS